MSYPGGKQQTPLIPQGGNYPQIYSTQVYSYDKPEVTGGGLQDGRASGLAPQQRYQQQQRMYAAPQPGDIAANSAAVAYHQQQSQPQPQQAQQQPQSALMRPPAGGMGYGQRGGQAPSMAGPRPQPGYGQHMSVPPPSAPPFVSGHQQSTHNVMMYYGNRVHPSQSMPNNYMPLPYMAQYPMQPQPQGAPHPYQTTPVWQPQQMHYGMQQAHAPRPVQNMQPPAAQPAPAAKPKRSNRIIIINPTTGQEVNVAATDEPTAKDDSNDSPEHTDSSVTAEFAKKVAQVASEPRHSRAASTSDARSRTASETAPAAESGAAPTHTNGALSSPEATLAVAASAASVPSVSPSPSEAAVSAEAPDPTVAAVTSAAPAPAEAAVPEAGPAPPSAPVPIETPRPTESNDAPIPTETPASTEAAEVPPSAAAVSPTPTEAVEATASSPDVVPPTHTEAVKVTAPTAAVAVTTSSPAAAAPAASPAVVVSAETAAAPAPKVAAAAPVPTEKVETPAPSAATVPSAAAGPEHKAEPTQPQKKQEEEGRPQHSQKKTKSKQKMRELSRRAEGKEGGGDMDAFVDAKPAAPAPAAAKPPTSKPVAPPTEQPAPPAAAVPEQAGEPAAPVQPATAAPETPEPETDAPAEPAPAAAAASEKPTPAAQPEEPAVAADTAADRPAPVEEEKTHTPAAEPEPAGEETAEKPAVNGDAAEPEPPAKSAWQLQLDRMKAESVAIGRKMSYNRDDLMKLMGHPLSQKRPDQLPDLPSIVRKDRSQGDARAFAAIKSRSMGPTTGMPEYGAGLKPLHNKAYRGGRGSQQGRREMQGSGPPGGGPRGPMQISLNRDVKLKTTENAWKPASKEVEGEDAESKTIRLLKGILNKLTPNNITKMIAEIKKLELNKESLLQKMIITLFDKAVDEPMYADQYATLCVAMAKTEAEGQDGKPVTFRKLILTQCQREFEKDKSGELNREERMVEISKITDERARREKKHLLDEEARKMRMRSNGNIHFIGELYKLNMLTDKIMFQCIIKLMRDKHEDSYECLCKLMTTIGQKLELSENKREKNLDSLFNDFSKLSKDMSLPSRIRFMLQDLIDMRKNNWVNTRTVGQAKPMTIEEVHKQAAIQQAKEQNAVAVQLEDRRRNAPDSRGPDRRGGSGGGRTGRGSQGGAGPDGWSTVNRNRFDPSRVMNAINTGASQLEQMRLGPGGGGPGVGWSMGSKRSGGRAPPTVQPARTEVRTSTNIFNMLSDDDSSGQPPMRLAPGGGRPRVEAARPPPQPARTAAPAGPQLVGRATLTTDEMQGKVRMICEEYIANKDFSSSILDVEEHLHQDTVAMFVTESLSMYVDARSTEQRHLVGELHRRLLESSHFRADAYLKGVAEILAVAVDLATDIPSVWANLGELLAPPVSTGKAVSLASLSAPAAALVSDGYGPKFVVALLKRLSSLHGADKVRALVPANQDWTLYFGTTDHVQPLVNAQLGFLVAGANVPLSTEEAPESRGVRSLLTRVRQEADLELWLNRNISDTDRADPTFIRDFICALCFDAIFIDNGAKKVELSRLEKQSRLLKNVITSAEQELAALYGAMTLVRHLQFPPGVLDQLFRQFYDMDVISEPTFQRWREGTNPAEQEGMGVALMSVKAFFQALEEAAAAGDDDEPRT